MPRTLIGIDEVGRGSLAGPVVLAAVAVSGRFRWTHPTLGRIRDSKKLTPKRRETWSRYLTTHPSIRWAIARVSQQVIDRINISHAANRGALRLVERLTPQGKRCRILLDGGLVIPRAIAHKTIIKGDERFPVIAAASIIAKVSRDRTMVRLGKRFPQYGFEIHKGYATPFHRRMLKRHGPSMVHRKTFLA